MSSRSWLLLCVSLSLPGCQDLKRFEPRPGETYCGTMVSAPVFHEGLLPTGVPPVLSMRLDLAVDSLDTRPGTLTTGDASVGLCSPGGQPLFNKAPLRAIEPLAHDALSFLEFGDGRELNLLAWVDSTCQGSMLSVVSLMKGGSVEVRLLKPKPLASPTAPPADQAGFGVFHLARKPESDCAY